MVFCCLKELFFISKITLNARNSIWPVLIFCVICKLGCIFSLQETVTGSDFSFVTNCTYIADCSSNVELRIVVFFCFENSLVTSVYKKTADRM